MVCVQERLVAERYRLIRPLGRGGMAEVYLARDERLGREVALKRLSDSALGDAEARARFQREAQVAAAVTHPNVVSVFDWGEDADGTPFLVLEYVPGPTLAEHLRDQGRLPEERALGLAADIADGLSAVHAAGFVHRDVKPHNVLLGPDGHARLADFGIARASDVGSTLTRPIDVLGTAAYFAPEQVRGAPADARGDQYSLGVVLYQMLAGQTPFHADSAEALALQHTRALPPRITDISAGAWGLVQRAMEKDPDRRFPSASAMAVALREAARHDSVATTQIRLPVGAAVRSAAPTVAPVAAAGAPPHPTEPRSPFRRVHTATTPTAAPPQTRSRRRFSPLWFALPVLVALGVAAALGARPPTSLAADARVPDVAGLKLEEARALFQGQGLEVDATEAPTLDTPRGLVVTQDPLGGKGVARGTRVKVTLSSGVRVPNLVGKLCTEAATEVAPRGWSVRPVRWLVANAADFGKVVQQDPAPDSLAEKKGEIQVQMAGPVRPCPAGSGTSAAAPAPPPAPTSPPAPTATPAAATRSSGAAVPKTPPGQEKKRERDD